MGARIVDSLNSDLISDCEESAIVTGDCNQATCGSYVIEEDEKNFMCNIKNVQRNTKYNKIVHDTRNQQSVFYGITDDILVSHDELNKRYETWALHDSKLDEKCEEIIHLTQRWPSASPKHCRDGIDMLHQLLSSIIEQIRSQKTEATFQTCD